MLAMLLSAPQQTFAAVGGRSDNEPLQLKRERSQPTTTMTTENAGFLRDFLTANIEGEHAATRGFVCEIEDESFELRLADGLPTIATQLHHAFASGLWFLSVVRRRHAEWSENAMVPFEGSKQSLLDACRGHSEQTENLLRSFSPDELIAEVFFNNERFPAVYMADWHIVHLVHHRAMASSVLPRHGLKNPCFYGAVPV
jgi:uncharacterized damage-inducible protein DinB